MPPNSFNAAKNFRSCSLRPHNLNKLSRFRRVFFSGREFHAAGNIHGKRIHFFSPRPPRFLRSGKGGLKLS
jgi:hypothetical protein